MSTSYASGPGLGGILPAQGDYFQATKGGGHGDYRNIVLAPASIQELYELTVEAFNLADRYRMLTLILGDGTIGQMMEPVASPRNRAGCYGRQTVGDCRPRQPARTHRTVKSIYIEADVMEGVNNRLQAKYREGRAEREPASK